MGKLKAESKPLPGIKTGELLPAESKPHVPPDPAPYVNILDPKEPRSVLNLLPKEVRKLVEEAHFQNPELFGLDEETLYKLLRSNNATPIGIENTLRQRFWMEYDLCQSEMRAAMQIKAVTGRLISNEFFYTNYLTKPSRVAWLLCPPIDYMLKAEEALNFSLQQMRDVLALEHVHVMKDAEGTETIWKIDHKLIEIKLKIHAMLEPRVKGAVLQKSANVHVLTGNPQVAKQIEGALQKPTMEQMEARLKRLRQAERELGQGGAHGKRIPDVEEDDEDDDD